MQLTKCLTIIIYFIVYFLPSYGSFLFPSPISEQVFFYHYSRNDPETAEEMKIGESLSDNVNTSIPWKFFVHGWTTNPELSPWFGTGKTAYFNRDDYNVVFVDWSIPGNKSYLESCFNSAGSGKQLGKFILHLANNSVNLSDIHLVGHSLGSHMVGFAGKYVKEMAKKRIGRITGLDPAGPVFERNSLMDGITDKVAIQYRLSKDDAQFVDIIHTDAKNYGIFASIGHIDFFPNGGQRIQPGCEKTDDENCSHARSTEFFVESINCMNFVAQECYSYDDFKNNQCSCHQLGILGEDCNPLIRGDFYLMTRSEPPYALGKSGSFYTSTSSSISKKGYMVIPIFVIFIVMY